MSQAVRTRIRRGGLSRLPEYTAWRDMRRRCSDPNHPRFADYGGRGITVCEAWASSFDTFLADVGRRPSPAHSLDRRENGRGYEPGNVRWATRVEQARNTRTSRLVMFDDVEMTLAEACERAGISRNTVRQRLFQGWPVERALDEPLDEKRSVARRGW